MSILLPGHVAAQIVRERDDSLREASHVMDVFKRLKAVDSRIEDMWLATEDHWVTEDRSGEPDFPRGFWFVSRRNDEGKVSIFKVANPDGSYREPDDALVEAFKQSDLWNGENYRRLREGWREQDRRRRAEAEAAKAEQREHLKELADFKFRVQVPVTPDGRGRLTSRRPK